jgi:hypothetical protein
MDYSRQLEGEYVKLLNFLWWGGSDGLGKKEYVGGVSGDEQQPREADVLMI